MIMTFGKVEDVVFLLLKKSFKRVLYEEKNTLAQIDAQTKHMYI